MKLKVIMSELCLISLLLIGCSTGQASPTPTTASVILTPTSTTTETKDAPPTTEPTATEATTSTTEETAPTTNLEDATPNIVAAANAFLETLSDSEQADVLFDWSNTEQKTRWSNLPEGLYERDGLMWGNLSEAQQNAWLALMEATLSTEGYNQVLAEWNADDELAGLAGCGAVDYFHHRR